MSCRSILVSMAAALSFAVAAAAPAQGQEGGAPAPPPPDTTQAPEATPEASPSTPASPAPAAPAAGAPAGADSLGAMLPALAEIRLREEILRDLEDSRAHRQAAENRMLAAREREIRWKTQTDAKKSEIETIKKQIDVAKKEKRQGEQKDLEAEKKRLELTRDFMEDMRQVYESEAAFHKAAFDYFQARLVSVEAESLVAGRWASDPNVRLSAEGRDLEGRAIQLVRTRADKMAVLATREKELSDRKKAALEGWAALKK